MSTGSSDTRPFGKLFQVRWAEKLGDPRNPYLVRWTLVIFGFTIRLHHWLRSDDRRYFHDHAADFISIIMKGRYANVTPNDPELPPMEGGNEIRHSVSGLLGSWYKPWRWKDSVWFSRAKQRHYLDIPKQGAWTLLIEGRPRNKWGFYVPRKGETKVRKMRPLEYFHRFGIIQADPEYQ